MELALGIIGTVTGLAGVVFGFLGWKRAGDALKETRRDPVRQEQHRILSERSGQLRELEKLLRQVNTDVQSNPQPDELRCVADQLASMAASLMAEPRIVDPELRKSLTAVSHAVAPHDDRDGGVSGVLRRYADICQEVTERLQRPGDSQGVRNDLVSVGERRARLHDNTRDGIRYALEHVDRALERVRQIEAEGFGDFPARPAPLPR